MGKDMPKKPLENLTESMFYVLMSFSVKPLCGIEVVDFIEQRTGGRVKLGPATLYTILAKFEKVNYITEITIDGRKRTYRITEKGLLAYHEELLRLQKCIRDAYQEGEISDERLSFGAMPCL